MRPLPLRSFWRTESVEQSFKHLTSRFKGQVFSGRVYVGRDSSEAEEIVGEDNYNDLPHNVVVNSRYVKKRTFFDRCKGRVRLSLDNIPDGTVLAAAFSKRPNYSDRYLGVVVESLGSEGWVAHISTNDKDYVRDHQGIKWENTQERKDENG